MEYRIYLNTPPSSFSNAFFPLSAVDYVAPPMFNCWCLFFEMGSLQKCHITDSLRFGLESAITQSPWLAGTIQEQLQSGYGIAVNQDSSVTFVVQHLDGQDNNFPSFGHFKKNGFRVENSHVREILWLSSMKGGTIKRPEAGMVVFGACVSFLKGGYVLAIHTHHSTADGSGVASIIHQWAECICNMIHGKAIEPVDRAAIDRSALAISLPAPRNKIIEQPSPVSGPKGHPMTPKVKKQLIFHLPYHRAVELKKMAVVKGGINVSTYDAFVALWWRLITRHRQRKYGEDPRTMAVFHEAVDMRSKLVEPLRVPLTYQGNCWARGVSSNLPSYDQLTLSQVSSESPLSQIATVVRKTTNSVTHRDVQSILSSVALKEPGSVMQTNPITSHRMAVGVTDWRNTRLCDTDFGLNKPAAFRRLTSRTHGMTVVVYPSQNYGEDPRGIDFDLLVEPDIVPGLLNDNDLSQWFEYLGEMR